MGNLNKSLAKNLPGIKHPLKYFCLECLDNFSKMSEIIYQINFTSGINTNNIVTIISLTTQLNKLKLSQVGFCTYLEFKNALMHSQTFYQKSTLAFGRK